MDNMNSIAKIFSLFFVVLFFAGCETTKPTVNVHGEKPLIDTSKVVSEGKKQIDKINELVQNLAKYCRISVYFLSLSFLFSFAFSLPSFFWSV